jgi:hypothetical protein
MPRILRLITFVAALAAPALAEPYAPSRASNAVGGELVANEPGTALVTDAAPSYVPQETRLNLRGEVEPVVWWVFRVIQKLDPDHLAWARPYWPPPPCTPEDAGEPILIDGTGAATGPGSVGLRCLQS